MGKSMCAGTVDILGIEKKKPDLLFFLFQVTGSNPTQQPADKASYTMDMLSAVTQAVEFFA